MWIVLAMLGTPVMAADRPEPAPVAYFAQEQLPPPRAMPPPGFVGDESMRRLKKAKNLRTAGVAMGIAGLPVGLLGIGLWVGDTSEAVEGAGGLLLFAGVGAALAGPGVTIAGGYTARRLILDLGGSAARGLEVAALVSWGVVIIPFWGTIPAVGFSWAFANKMISQAERAIEENAADRRRSDAGSADRQFSIRALPTFHARTRRAGLRVDVTY